MQPTMQRLAAVAVAATAYAIALGMRVGIDTTLIWPPSRSSAPFLVGCVLTVLVVMVVSFGGASPEQAHVRSVKRSRFLAQLAQALRWDEPREDERLPGDQQEDAVDDPARGEQGGQQTLHHAGCPKGALRRTIRRFRQAATLTQAR